VRRALALTLLLLAVPVVSACGKDDEPSGGERAATQTAANGAARTSKRPTLVPRNTEDGCAPVAVVQPRPAARLRKPRRSLNQRRRYVATLRTNCGTIDIRLDVREFPKTTRSFVRLTRARFYDGLGFHRIAKPGGNDFVIQAGDPQGNGEGGPGYSVVERPPRGATYPFGTVAMAKAGDEKSGTSGSQFFIVTGDGAGLDPLYAIVGRVVAGRDAVKRIAAVPTDPVTEEPIDPVVVKRVTIKESKR
jgi:cyclophilin family peptidyl-prolyl cis-trans isomerase